MGSKKTLDQKIALAQDRLNKLKKVSLEKERREREHKKFLAGGEVTKALGLDYDIEILVGFLDHFKRFTDEQRLQLKNNGKSLIKSRQKNAEK
ncbi:MAG: conjugal transfer protein TraD [Finegoldia magna]|jgi:hypothetical protein|uniref:conjugal transfer protein TraD n=1 Tax=Finegoldia magna TaxID=1260 RepID=UPI002913CD10|nr:conjugal transfer protein TraD [Finegoldia magna]MDU7331535.1 conjugal transfer protein TraD [Finegoldia magna]